MSTELAVHAPAPPTPAEWNMYLHQAEVMSKSGLVPQAFRGKPNDIVVAALYGRDLSMSVSAALQYVVVIQGKPTLNASGRVAIIRRAGHSITGSKSATKATVTGKRHDNGDTHTCEWTMERATRAGLLSNPTWKKYPEAMLWARAVTELSRDLFEDLFLGATYGTEEMQDMQEGERAQATAVVVVDDDGRHVDTSTGEVLEVTAEAVDEPITAATLKRVHTMLGGAGVSGEADKRALWSLYGYESSRQLTEAQAKALCRELGSAEGLERVHRAIASVLTADEEQAQDEGEQS